MKRAREVESNREVQYQKLENYFNSWLKKLKGDP